ncbi:tetratricopeptide repeat protein [Streptomyces sp. NPDC127197]|uniref:tetratricopeptide repeat protein n=1 Tax=Streptomyces sp. NPDC127197 TaxID=3345388 RepID=UPI00363BAD96
MSRLSREKKREQQHQAASAVSAIDVHVPGAGNASIGGVPVVAVPGEELQHAVLNHLHRVALATGRPVLARVHDERIGYVVPLQVHPDGSSRYTGEPVRTGAAEPQPSQEPAPVPPHPSPDPAPTAPPHPPQPPASDRPTQVFRTPAEPQAGSAPTFRMRAVPESSPSGEAAPTFPQRAVTEPQPLGDAVPTFPLRAMPEGAVPGSAVAAPTGEFGPPPVMDAKPHPESFASSASDPDPKPTPPRGFDAVAEAILGDAPGNPGNAENAEEHNDPAPAVLVEPIARIGEAVKAGRIDAAAELAEQTLAEASATLAPDHPELLRLRELTAYVAYLAAEPVRSFRLSLDVVHIHRRLRDAEAAYGNIQSADTAWRAVRDPALGLELGRDLIGLWTELVTEGGPAADDIEELESARARMGRLANRAGRATGA